MPHLPIRKALNKAFLKVKPNRSQIEIFKTNLTHLLDQANDKESEEFHKNLVSTFLKDTYYGTDYAINTKERTDLVIHTGKTAKSGVGVLIEAKSPTNKAQFIYILPNKWMRAGYGDKLRNYLQSQNIESIVDFGDLPVFEEATTYPCIMRIEKAPNNHRFESAVVETLTYDRDLTAYVAEKAFEVDSQLLQPSGWTLRDVKVQRLLEKLRNTGVPLGEYVEGKIYYGIKTGLNEAFEIDAQTREKLIEKDPNSAEIIKPFLAGRDIKRYKQPESDKYLILFKSGDTRKLFGEKVSESDGFILMSARYPAIMKYLKQFEAKAKKRYDKGQFWWELRACDYYDKFEKAKIMYPDISKEMNFLIDNNGHFCANTAYNIETNSNGLLGILNSKLLNFYYLHLSNSIRGGYMRFFTDYVESLPIPENLASLEQLVGELMKQVGKSEFEKLEVEIDKLVYELYGLSEEEIKIIASSKIES